jgi:hypothetical protein
MTVSELIAELSKMPPDATVYREGGEYKDDWREVSQVDVEYFSSLGKTRGVYLE